MKKLLFAILFCTIFISCSSVKNDMPVQILSSYLCEKIEGADNLAQASTDYIKYCMSSDLSLYSEYIVLYPFGGTKYNEIGIFKMADGNDINDGISEVEGYLLFKKSNWDKRYKNEEFDKIGNARITSYGNYILYTILNEKESEDVISEFKKQLK